MIFSHLDQEWADTHVGVNNGAYWYSKEIVERIIPKIKTNRNWVTVNVEGCCFDHSIVFIHNNANPERYWWLYQYEDLILICSQIKTLKFLIQLFPKFHIVYVPLSIDTNYVKQFKPKRKSKKTAYFGRECKCPKSLLEDDSVDKLWGKGREKLLSEVGKYKNVYAIGRCALEAKCLGCKVTTHEGEYEGEEFNLLDNDEVIPIIQRLLDEIDSMV